MLTLYFSGTGNTKYIADEFSKVMAAQCHSVEEMVDFQQLITEADTIVFCYPIYGSCVPIIMRQFVARHKTLLNYKKMIILCTQNLFSGDGARVFVDLLADISFEIIYAEHFYMPNNICNLFFYPLSSQKRIQRYKRKADQKIIAVSRNIKHDIVKKRGFNDFSKFLGFIAQRVYFSKIEETAKKDVRINSDCINCLLCIKICPMENLEEKNHKIVQMDNCTLCYRCVNACPKKAITVLQHGKVKRQYKGLGNG